MTNKARSGFGIILPQKFPDGRVDTGYIRAFVSMVEATGYDSVWLGEGHFSPIPNLASIPLLTYAAALTNRVKVGVSALLSAFRGPVPLAEELATLDQLSNGRLIAGVAIGAGTDHYPAFGMDPSNRVSRFEEGIRLLKALWTQDRVTFHGRFWSVDGAAINPRPYQKPHPPLWFGAHAVPALRRAAKMGDGWMGSGATSTAEFKQDAQLIRRFLQEEGRDPAAFPISKRVYLALDPDRERALGRVKEMMGYIYGKPEIAEKVAVFGGEQQVIEGLRGVIQEGTDLLLLHPVYDLMGHAERLARDVLPKL